MLRIWVCGGKLCGWALGGVAATVHVAAAAAAAAAASDWGDDTGHIAGRGEYGRGGSPGG